MLALRLRTSNDGTALVQLVTLTAGKCVKGGTTLMLHAAAAVQDSADRKPAPLLEATAMLRRHACLKKMGGRCDLSRTIRGVGVCSNQPWGATGASSRCALNLTQLSERGCRGDQGEV
jgi:hypothetical protein